MLRINVKQLFCLIFVSLIAISCDDDSNPMAEDHIDAEGFILESNETEIYREFEGAIVVNNLNLTTTGESSVLELSVHFLDHDGNEIEHEEEEGDEDELSFSIADSSIISVVAEDHEEDGDEGHHELAFELTGLSAGTTTFTLSLMHDGHADYTSLPISVTVNE